MGHLPTCTMWYKSHAAHLTALLSGSGFLNSLVSGLTSCMQCQAQTVSIGLHTEAIEPEALLSLPVPAVQYVPTELIVPSNAQETQVADTVFLHHTTSLQREGSKAAMTRSVMTDTGLSREELMIKGKL